MRIARYRAVLSIGSVSASLPIKVDFGCQRSIFRTVLAEGGRRKGRRKILSVDFDCQRSISSGISQGREKKNLESHCSSLALSVARVVCRPRGPLPTGNFFAGGRFLLLA
ncbi:hypothetical protein B296_00009272, partial [Ensete ventricosum]